MRDGEEIPESTIIYAQGGAEVVPITVPPAPEGTAPTTGAERLQTDSVPGVTEAPPGYMIERELGRGGMGVVYLAHQQGLNRKVALKMLHGTSDATSLIRFLAEAEAVAAVQHPHVVEVYHYGEHRGLPFLALEYCPGGSLNERLPGGQSLAPRAAAELLAKIAAGVQAAHALGIVHRDVKPHNVLLTETGEPKVTDFGIAKRGDRADLTRTNAIMGTPAYMPPEQAKGDAKFVGPQADVWALGVMLYELLTGQRPFSGTDSWNMLVAVMNGAFAAPRKVNLGVPHDLELICLKCLNQEPHQRYATAGALADDLHNWLTGQTIQARAAGLGERGWKWARRNRALAGAIVGVALTLVVATVLSSWLAFRAMHAESATALQLEQTQRAEAEARERSNEATAALAESRKLSERLEAALIENGRQAALNYVAYGQLFATASRLANATDRKEAERLLAEYRRLADWVATEADPKVRAAAADFSNALATWSAGPPPEPLKQKSLKLAQTCKASWLKTVEQEHPDLVEKIRRRLYTRACTAATALLDRSNLGRVEQARQEIWELYWGELVLVESRSVETAMVRLGGILRQWPTGEPPPAQLAAAVADLRRACDNK